MEPIPPTFNVNCPRYAEGVTCARELTAMQRTQLKTRNAIRLMGKGAVHSGVESPNSNNSNGKSQHFQSKPGEMTDGLRRRFGVTVSAEHLIRKLQSPTSRVKQIWRYQVSRPKRDSELIAIRAWAWCDRSLLLRVRCATRLLRLRAFS